VDTKASDPAGLEYVADAIRRAQRALGRRPGIAVHDDAPATARWDTGTRVVSAHPNGASIGSDMPSELGGSGAEVTPGWLFRAGLASCAATCIAMAAATEGIVLTTLEVVARGRSDARGVLGMSDGNGGVVTAAPIGLALEVRIAASGVAPERLRALADHAVRRSPIAEVVQVALPLELRVELQED
jgi:uncharacterized OsmC-like protein